jgi:hypothetical protein
MDEKENLTQDLSEMPDEEIAALEKERKQAWEDKIAPCRKAAEQRKNNAAIVAEHDDMLADMLYELTMNEMEV